MRSWFILRAFGLMHGRLTFFVFDLGAAVRIDIVILVVDQFGNGDDLVTLLAKIGDDLGKGIGGVEPVVMKKDNCPLVGAAGDPLDDLFPGQVLPVQGVYAPLNGFISKLSGYLDDLVAVFAEGRAEEACFLSRNPFDHLLDSFELSPDLVPGQAVQMRVSQGMIPDLMAFLGLSLIHI